jgi:phosphatidylglycerophosphate synthase
MLKRTPEMDTTPARPREVRDHRSILAAAEKRCLVWMAERLPGAVNSDHLTALGAAGMAACGLCYAISPGRGWALPAAIVLLAVNWFGDSLDGTLARVRHQERPRYGFYVDHVLDVIGILMLVGGLVVGGHLSPGMGAGFLIAYYLLMIEIALATHTVGTFQISYWSFGPTELRILLAAGTVQLMRSDYVVIAGSRWLLFDLGTAAAIAGLVVTFGVSAVMHARTLYQREPVPGARRGEVGDQEGSPHQETRRSGGSSSLSLRGLRDL